MQVSTINSIQSNYITTEKQSQQGLQDSLENPAQQSERTEVITWLGANNYPALPVAPAQDAKKHPKIVKADAAKGIWQHCPLTANLQPIPLYTGKNPSYLDQDGIPHLINHREYQKRLPNQEELERWFANPANGVGTLGGWNNIIWLDFDVKQFSSQSDCDIAASQRISAIQIATGKVPFTERTHSGGWRIGVRVASKPTFTNFSLTPGGNHVGEALGEGRFTVLAPTIGVSGKPYRNISRECIPEVESLEAIGIYSTSVVLEQERVRQSKSTPIAGTIRLEDLGCEDARKVLAGDDPKLDRSASLTVAIKEWKGWENWCQRNNIHYSGTHEDLAHQAAQALDIDEKRCDRIIKSVKETNLQPAAYYRGGDESCWKKIYRLDRASFDELCPEILRDRIKAERRQNFSRSGGSGGSGGGDGNGGGDGSDHLEEEPTEQNFWKAPVSWHGEMGWLSEKEVPVTEKDEEGNEVPVIGEDDQPVTEKVFRFLPKCNFDFVVERELESEDGGGIVLQVKRSLDRVQKRVIINSVDYGSVRTFEKALKQALGSGIVINLKDEELKALIHVRLRDYRERGGKSYKLIDRYGQQPDGIWVFRDRQLKPDGTPTNEEESGWVFNPALGKEDFIPCPELAPEDPEALKRLVDACREFFGEKNIHQVLMTMGWVVSGIHSQAIFKHDDSFSLLNSNGEPGSFKTLAAEACLSLVGKNWAQMGMLARVSISALYEHGSRTAGLPFMMDDPERSDQLEEIFKTWYNWKPRRVRGNDQQPKSPLGVITNHVVGAEQAATFTRFIRLTYERVTDGNKQAFQELRKAQETASGAFPLLLKIGYDPEAIATIERDLLPHLPLAHARIAQSLAIPLYYAEKLVELTGYSHSYNLKQWVIENCCKSENDSDNSADSLQDFIDKALSLESESLVGSWNLKRDVERDGKTYVALFASEVWSLVDKHFKPATYNFKSLKPLVLKAGGVIDITVRFNRDRDSVLAYERALITPRQSQEGDVEPNPPATTPRKAWLIPINLFCGDESPVTGVTECNRISVTPQNDEIARVTHPSEVACNCVTEKIEIEKEKEKPDTPTTVVSVEEDNFQSTPENSGYNGYTVTGVVKTTVEQGLEPVTETCENPVTVTEISVTKAVTPDLGGEEVIAPVAHSENTTEADEYTEEDIEDIARILADEVLCADKEALAGLRGVWNNAEAMNKACKRLTVERHAQIKEWVIELNSQQFQVGDRVNWSECPGHCEQFAPFVITAIDGECAKLDLFENPVPLVELRKA
jgi:hypothetical protein